MSEDSEKSEANHKKWMATMEALTDVSLKMTEACLEKTCKSGKSRNHDGSVYRRDECGAYGALEDRFGDRCLAIRQCKRRRNGPRVMVRPDRSWLLT
jgi:hypothetical protein